MSNRTMTDRYRAGSGMLAWVLNRLTGLLLSVYLLLHIWKLSAAYGAGAGSLREALVSFNTPLWMVLDVLMVAALVFHTLNGVRVMLFDAGVGLRYQAALFWTSLIASLFALVVVAVRLAQ